MKLLNYKTAAEILDCSPSKVQKLCLAGEIPIIKVGNETKIDPDDLQQWISGRKHKICSKPNGKQAISSADNHAGND